MTNNCNLFKKHPIIPSNILIHLVIFIYQIKSSDQRTKINAHYISNISLSENKLNKPPANSEEENIKILDSYFKSFSMPVENDKSIKNPSVSTEKIAEALKAIKELINLRSVRLLEFDYKKSMKLLSYLTILSNSLEEFYFKCKLCFHMYDLYDKQKKEKNDQFRHLNLYKKLFFEIYDNSRIIDKSDYLRYSDLQNIKFFEKFKENTENTFDFIVEDDFESGESDDLCRKQKKIICHPADINLYSQLLICRICRFTDLDTKVMLFLSGKNYGKPNTPLVVNNHKTLLDKIYYFIKNIKHSENNDDKYDGILENDTKNGTLKPTEAGYNLKNYITLFITENLQRIEIGQNKNNSTNSESDSQSNIASSNWKLLPKPDILEGVYIIVWVQDDSHNTKDNSRIHVFVGLNYYSPQNRNDNNKN
ncbi:hypothetical protein EDEG_00298 [Edhazardia aedis USNM 41457]|uniref:Uncharacterized protein n=1 Tax=Edhazardia aedis (strain USNM 41457) TaxID=1003232 RepID=J9D3A4_EDHAE|nr:hypothetical protein EDEG_00298 [Edhazardia aedis USNM 41457]|eukprot:EJW02321.1 hypothetical protein EDEG_00298 [Edhazardia aedis USNM 41457]